VIRRLRPWAPFFLTGVITFSLGATGAGLVSQLVAGAGAVAAYALGRKDEERAYLAAMRWRAGLLAAARRRTP
jgi:hypothetical protein